MRRMVVHFEMAVRGAVAWADSAGTRSYLLVVSSPGQHWRQHWKKSEGQAVIAEFCLFVLEIFGSSMVLKLSQATRQNQLHSAGLRLRVDGCMR